MPPLVTSSGAHAVDTADPAPWLTAEERHPLTIAVNGCFVDAIRAFQDHPGLRLLPVLDAQGAPLGAIFERDVRRIVLSPFGHALMRNPAYGAQIRPHMRPCPIADAGLDLAALIRLYHEAQASEGMILVHRGRLHATLTNRRLNQLAGELERARVAHQVARANRIGAAGRVFEAQAGTLSQAMGELSAMLERHAADTTDQSAAASTRASSVAAAAQQTEYHMAEVAECGRALLLSLDGVGERTRAAQRAVCRTVDLASRNTQQMAALRQSSESVQTVVALIADIASKVNLLALNATIEAARAGAAGRGFTVVANEVKALSHQTANAARTIAGQVTDMTGAIDGVAAGCAEIRQGIAAIARLSQEIEAAVDDQRADTQLIADRVAEVREASAATRHDVQQIADIAEGVAASAGQVRTLARRLSAGSGALGADTARLLSAVRDD